MAEKERSIFNYLVLFMLLFTLWLSVMMPILTETEIIKAEIKIRIIAIESNLDLIHRQIAEMKAEKL